MGGYLWLDRHELEHDLHVNHGLSDLPPHTAEEPQRHGKLEQEAIDHNEAADTHIARHDVLGGHHHDHGQGRAEDQVLTKVQSGQGLASLQGGSLVLLEVCVVNSSLVFLVVEVFDCLVVD